MIITLHIAVVHLHLCVNCLPNFSWQQTMARAAAYTYSAASRVRRSELSLSAGIAVVVEQELAEDVRQRLIVTLFCLQGRGSEVWLLHLLNHISSASCLQQIGGLLGQGVAVEVCRILNQLDPSLCSELTRCCF